MLTLQGAGGWRVRFPPLDYYLDVVQDTWDTAIATLYDAAGQPIRSVSIWNNVHAGQRPWLCFDDQRCRTFPAEYHQLPRFAEYTLAGVTDALDCGNASALNTTYILSQVRRDEWG